MKITKAGNEAKLKKYIKFKCEDCDCEFIADNTEYEYEFNQHDGASYEITCPCCHKRKYMYDQNVIEKYNCIPKEIEDEPYWFDPSLDDSYKIKQIDFIKKDGSSSTLNNIYSSTIKYLGIKNGHNKLQIDVEVSL